LDILKSLLSLENSAGIPINDQILLCGPAPFRRLESVERAQTVFLYDQRALMLQPRAEGDHGHIQLLPLRLETFDSTAVTGDLELSSLLKGAYVTPLLKALPDYDTHFLRRRKEGKHMLDCSIQCFNSCADSCSAQAIHVEAVAAAISNLQEHYASIRLAFESQSEKLVAQQVKLLHFFYILVIIL
jgi:hypothetical protein